MQRGRGILAAPSFGSLFIKNRDNFSVQDPVHIFDSAEISAHGAGMNPVMIPDIVQDTSKVDDILFGKCESLLEFAEILQGVTLDIEETQK